MVITTEFYYLFRQVLHCIWIALIAVEPAVKYSFVQKSCKWGWRVNTKQHWPFRLVCMMTSITAFVLFLKVKHRVSSGKWVPGCSCETIGKKPWSGRQISGIVVHLYWCPNQGITTRTSKVCYSTRQIFYINWNFSLLRFVIEIFFSSFSPDENANFLFQFPYVLFKSGCFFIALQGYLSLAIRLRVLILPRRVSGHLATREFHRQRTRY